MDMQRLMQQAQAMQRKLQAVEQELAATEYEGENNGVKVVVNGNSEVVSVAIDDELMDLENKDVLQDMVLLSVNSALKAAKDDRESKMGAITQGVRMPGM